MHMSVVHAVMDNRGMNMYLVNDSETVQYTMPLCLEWTKYIPRQLSYRSLPLVQNIHVQLQYYTDSHREVAIRAPKYVYFVTLTVGPGFSTRHRENGDILDLCTSLWRCSL